MGRRDAGRRSTTANVFKDRSPPNDASPTSGPGRRGAGSSRKVVFGAMSARGVLEPLVLKPIGFAHTPFSERASAPRQPYAAEGARGTIELLPNCDFEHALSDLDAWDHIWVIFWFHLNAGWRPKVLPPRSQKRRGVFATRSPHRPNPIGLSVVELEAIDGLTLKIRNVDLLDGTPVLDIKPYVPTFDAIAAERTGWLEAGAARVHEVRADFDEP